MDVLTAEEIDKLCSDTGRKLSEATEALETLVDRINFGPDLETGSALEKAFEFLQKSKQLVQIAWDLYPYPVQDSAK